MGREIRRVPVEFSHPIVWVERTKREPDFASMVGELTGASGGSYTSVTRWSHELARLIDKTLSQAQREWDEGLRAWESGENPSREKRWNDDDVRRAEERAADPLRHGVVDVGWYRQHVGEPVYESYADYASERPLAGEVHWQPEGWPPEEQRGWVVYETVSEGTPITPSFADPEELIDWLSTKGTAWDGPCSKEAAEGFVAAGWMPSGVSTDSGPVAFGLDVAENPPT